MIIVLHLHRNRTPVIAFLLTDWRVHGTRGTYVYDRGKCSLPLTVNRRGSISVARCTDTFEWNARNFIDIAMTVMLLHCCSTLVKDNKGEKKIERKYIIFQFEERRWDSFKSLLDLFLFRKKLLDFCPSNFH